MMNVLYWAGIAINAFFPILEGFFGVWLFVAFAATGDASGIKQDSFAAAVTGTCFVQIISGIVMIFAILKIKQASEAAGSKVDSRMLLVHLTAFGLYLVSVLSFGIAYVFYLASNFGKKSEHVVSLVSSIENCLSLASQLLLAYILIKLTRGQGDRSNSQLSTDSSRVKPLVV